MITGGTTLTCTDADLLELGKKIHDLFPKDYNDCSVYGVGWENGEVKDLEHHYCHMALMRGHRPYRMGLDVTGCEGPVVISNQVQYVYNDEGPWVGRRGMEKYYSFLFNESVFADCYVTKDPSTCIKDGITVRTDRPANLVVAACIATRQAWEFPEIGRTVNTLIEFGVEPRKAHLAAHIIEVKEDGEFFSNDRGGHIAVYASHMGDEAVKSFLSGTLHPSVEYNNSTYQKVRSYGRIPCMWGDSGGEGFHIDTDGCLPRLKSDPFGYIKHVGVIRPDVVEAIERAFERIE